MKRLIVALAALALAAQAQAARLDCVPLGSVITYQAFDGSELRTPVVVLGPALNFRFVVQRADAVGPKVGGGTTAQNTLSMAYFRCVVPGGGTLGSGAATWKHGGTVARIAEPGANTIQVAQVNTGAALDATDNAASGTVVGGTPAWPVGRTGSTVTAPVNFGGVSVGETFDVRLSSGNGPAWQVWGSLVNDFALDIEVGAPAVSETDALIAQLAAVLGIDAGALRTLLTALGGAL